MIGVAMLQTSYKADSASAPTVSGHSARKILPFRHWRLVISEELARRGWQESEWATRRRSDPGKLASAARLRSETTLPIKWIAARVRIGTAKGSKSVLHHLAQSQDQRKTAKALEPCAQLEFQSTVDSFPARHQ